MTGATDAPALVAGVDVDRIATALSGRRVDVVAVVVAVVVVVVA